MDLNFLPPPSPPGNVSPSETVTKEAPHLTYGCLQDGVKPAFRSVPVARYQLLLHLLVKSIHLVGQGENVPETEGGDALGEQLESKEGDRFKEQALFWNFFMHVML